MAGRQQQQDYHQRHQGHGPHDSAGVTQFWHQGVVGPRQQKLSRGLLLQKACRSILCRGCTLRYSSAQPHVRGVQLFWQGASASTMSSSGQASFPNRAQMCRCAPSMYCSQACSTGCWQSRGTTQPPSLSNIACFSGALQIWPMMACEASDQAATARDFVEALDSVTGGAFWTCLSCHQAQKLQLF